MGVGFFDLLSSCFIALSVIMIHDGLMIADWQSAFRYFNGKKKLFKLNQS